MAIRVGSFRFKLMSNSTYTIRDKIFIVLLLPSNAEFNVADEPFQRRFTVIEDFGRKSAFIEIHLTSIDMLVSVTVNSVNHAQSVSRFTTDYLPGKTFTNKVSSIGK